jgi:hypothetical protein
MQAKNIVRSHLAKSPCACPPGLYVTAMHDRVRAHVIEVHQESCTISGIARRYIKMASIFHGSVISLSAIFEHESKEAEL